MKIRLPVLLLLIMWLSSPAFSQEKLFRNYTVKEGLASNTVYKALVDKKGFLWFATEVGVSRFDGTAFTNFSADDGLADNDVLSMFEDDDGRIWFLCYNRRPCFYYKGKFFNASNFAELQKIKNYNWHMAFFDKNGVWFSGREGIYRFRDNKVTEYPMQDANRLALITKIDSTIYVLKDSIFFSLNEKNEKFEPCPGFNLSLLNAEYKVDLGGGNYIVLNRIDAHHTGLYRCKVDVLKRTLEKRLCCSFDKEIIKNTFDKKNNVLRTTFADNSVVEKDVLTDSLKTIGEYALNSFVSDIAVDDQGNKWFTLLYGGVKMLPSTQSNEISIPPKIKVNTAFYSIVSMNGEIAVGNNDNTLFFIRSGNLKEIKRKNFYRGNNRIMDMKMDKHNKLWLGTDKGIYTYNLFDKQFNAVNIHTNVKDIKYDSVSDMMLFATSNQSFGISCTNPSKTLFINNERTTSIVGNLSDTCWLATLNGLFRYNGLTAPPEKLSMFQFKSRVTSLEADSKKQLWVGTSSNGVFVTHNDSIIFHFLTGNGLTSNICKNIFIDQNDEAWISTNQGVSRVKIDGAHFIITKYNDKNCLVDNDVNDLLVLKDTVYVVSSTGIVFFNKNTIVYNYGFPVYITGIKAGNSEVGVEDSIVYLNSRQNTLSISFCGLSYLSNGDVGYEYYIKELNDKPVFTKGNAVTYSGLAPGAYNFYVNATDAFGNKSIQTAHITFIIAPEWYQLLWLRWAAVSAMVMLTIFITFWYGKRNEKRRRLRSELNQTISRLELEAIHSQINPHFIFNCLNAIQNAVYKNNVETASYFINRFAKLMRMALMLSKESFISIDEEYSFISNYLEVEQLRYNNSFDYTIEIDSTLNKSIAVVPAFVLQPFIENAINHGIKYLKGEKGMITLKFIKTDKLEIRLDDNGIGIAASKKIYQNSSGQYKSKGTELIYARVDSLNKIYKKNIQVKIIDKGELNDNTRGTTVIISLDLL